MGLPTDRALSYFVSLEAVELTPEYRSVIKSVLAWRGLFGGYWNRYFYTVEKSCPLRKFINMFNIFVSLKSSLRIRRLCLGQFQYQFTFSDSIPLKSCEDPI